MRDLLKPRTVMRATPLGLALAAACTPYILATSPPGPLRTMQLAFLPPIAILLAQVTIAWVPPAKRKGAPPSPSRRPWLILVLAALGVSVFAAAFVDPVTRKLQPGVFPDSLLELAVALPWVVVFQPLLTVAAVYAFALRLSRRPVIAFAAVVITRQGLLSAQLSAGASLPHLYLIIVTGTVGLILAWSFQRFGLPGPCLLALCAHIRHAVRFI